MDTLEKSGAVTASVKAIRAEHQVLNFSKNSKKEACLGRMRKGSVGEPQRVKWSLDHVAPGRFL